MSRTPRIALALLALLLLATTLAPAPGNAAPAGRPHVAQFSLRHGTPQRDADGHVQHDAAGKPAWARQAAPRKSGSAPDPYTFSTAACANWFFEPGLGSGPPYHGVIKSQTECAPTGTDFTPWLWAGYGGYTGPRYPIPRITEQSSFTSPAVTSTPPVQLSPVYQATNASELLSTWTSGTLATGNYYGHTSVAMTAPTGDLWDPSQPLDFRSDPNSDGLLCTLDPFLTVATCVQALQVPLVIPAFGTPVATATAQATATVAPTPTPAPAGCHASLSLSLTSQPSQIKITATLYAPSATNPDGSPVTLNPGFYQNAVIDAAHNPFFAPIAGFTDGGGQLWTNSGIDTVTVVAEGWAEVTFHPTTSLSNGAPCAPTATASIFVP